MQLALTGSLTPALCAFDGAVRLPFVRVGLRAGSIKGGSDFLFRKAGTRGAAAATAALLCGAWARSHVPQGDGGGGAAAPTFGRSIGGVAGGTREPQSYGVG